MTFTDDDLKRLKEFLIELDPDLQDIRLNDVSVKSLLSRLEAIELDPDLQDIRLNDVSVKSLLSRLEAAEELAEARAGSSYPRILAAVEAWRKAAGK